MSCSNKDKQSLKQIDYSEIIEDYLESKVIKPTIVFGTRIDHTYRYEFQLLEHKLSWKPLKKGIEITIDGYKISTSDKVTLNPVWGSGRDSVKFSNTLSEVHIFEEDSLIGFITTNAPCSGLGCGVNYQIIYDLKTKKESYFGKFRTGFEFNLYHFNTDNRPDYLSTTFRGRNEQSIDTTKYVMYSQTDKGYFEQFKSNEQDKFWFTHIYSEFHQDLNNEKFKESWIERICD